MLMLGSLQDHPASRQATDGGAARASLAFERAERPAISAIVTGVNDFVARAPTDRIDLFEAARERRLAPELVDSIGTGRCHHHG